MLEIEQREDWNLSFRYAKSHKAIIFCNHSESKTMVLQSRNLLKSQQFFVEQQAVN